MKRTDDRLHLKVRLIQYSLPLILFGVVATYETWEHLLTRGILTLEFSFASEVLIFGIIGPITVFVALSFINSLLRKEVSAGWKLEELNRDLEQRVVERTETLAARNAELARANEELTKLDQLKSDFVALVSHELRVPLTTLNGGLELVLQDGMHMPSESRRVLEVMVGESQRLTNLVQTILDVSRLEAGALRLNFGPVAVLPLLQRLVETMFADSQRHVIWTISDTLPPAWADETYLETIICNLLNNANKYSPGGQPIELAVRTSDGTLHVTVTDHGPGIPAEMQTQIFEPFHRLERGDRITTEGWGLGLYFANGLAQAQGGHLTVQSPVRSSDKDQGTAFTLSIPITEEVPDNG